MNNFYDYIHGGNAKDDFIRLNIEAKPIIDFSVNTNPLGPPKQIKQNWSSIYEEIERYPTQNGNAVQQYYKQKFKIATNNTLPGNGSAELFSFVMQRLKLTSILILSPSFNEYYRAASINSIIINELSFDVKNNFSLPKIDSVNKALQNCDGIILGYPNNPTGNSYSKAEIVFLAKQNPDKWILLDEAFIQFENNFKEQSFLIQNRPRNVIVFHSLTKFYSIPGVRLGAVIAHSKLISEWKKKKYLWSINSIAEALVDYLIDDEAFAKETIKLITEEQNNIYKHISSIKGIEIFPTKTNFFLAQWNVTNNLDDLQRQLLNNGLYVRDARNFPLLTNNYFRFAILAKSQNEKLISVIKNFIKTND